MTALYQQPQSSHAKGENREEEGGLLLAELHTADGGGAGRSSDEDGPAGLTSRSSRGALREESDGDDGASFRAGRRGASEAGRKMG